MDNYNDLIAYYLIDWQKAANDNMLYSLVLAAVAFLIGSLFVILLKKKKIAGLKQQLLKEKQALGQLEKKQEELLETQKNDAQHIAEIQQQQEQLAKNLQETEEKYNQELNNGEQLTQSLQEQQNRTDDLSQSMNDKTQQLEQLQTELEQQKQELTQSTLDKAKIEEMEKEIKLLSDELNSLNQQLQHLEIELNLKNDKIKQFEDAGRSAKEESARIVDLELQIEKLKHSNEPDNIQQVFEKQNTGNKTEYSIDLENAIKQHEQKIEQFNNKLQILLKNAPSKNNAKEEPGVVDKLLSFVASKDNQEISIENQIDKESGKGEDAWQKHEQLIDQLIEQYSGLQAEHSRKEDYSQKESLAISESAIEQPVIKPTPTQAEEKVDAPEEAPVKDLEIQEKEENKFEANESSEQLSEEETKFNYYEDNDIGEYKEKIVGFFKKFRS